MTSRTLAGTKGQHASIDVEDVSGDDLSIASVKGEGCGSDLSDSETKHPTNYTNQRTTTGAGVGRSAKKAFSFGAADPNLKRPTTPMDFRGAAGNSTTAKMNNRPSESAIKSVRFQQFNNDMSVGTAMTSRFNEWPPADSRQQQQQSDRQKSPLKSKQSGQQSGFAHSFLGQDSSPRQASGRPNINSATQKYMTTFQQQYHHQQLLQQQQQQQQSQFLLVNPLGNNAFGSNQIEANMSNNNSSSASNLDLIISGQKLGPRKESPTNTPRDSSAYHHQQQQRQSESSANSRSFTRRLQPIDKSANETANILNSSGEGQIFRQKTGYFIDIIFYRYI